MTAQPNRQIAGLSEAGLQQHFANLEDQLHAEQHADPDGCARCRSVLRGQGGL